MSLAERVNEAIKLAMKAKERERLDALRAIKAEVLLALTAEGATGEITLEAEIKLLQKMVKQRRDAALIYEQQSRNDLAAVEIEQALVIEEFLPKQLSDTELRECIQTIILETGANSVKDMGKVMGLATKQLAGKADGKRVSEFVKKALGI